VASCTFRQKKQLNDPFEYRWRDWYPKEPQDIDDLAKVICIKNWGKLEPDHFRWMRKELSTRAAKHGGVIPTDTVITKGVFSASEINNDILMWSHYADHHRGICVGVVPAKVCGKHFRRVEYDTHVPVLNLWEYAKDVNPYFIKHSLFKSDRWKHEAEWRTMDEVGPIKFAGCIDQAIIGAETSVETRAEVLETVRSAEHEIDVFEASLSGWSFGLEIEPLPPRKS
jgi:hypothetical protein